MRYGKLVNGVFVEAPKNLKLPDGRVICNFNSNIDIMDEHGFKPSSHVEEFKDELLRLHINCTVRKEHGRDIDGACGQLRAKRSGVI